MGCRHGEVAFVSAPDSHEIGNFRSSGKHCSSVHNSHLAGNKPILYELRISDTVHPMRKSTEILLMTLAV